MKVAAILGGPLFLFAVKALAYSPTPLPRPTGIQSSQISTGSDEPTNHKTPATATQVLTPSPIDNHVVRAKGSSRQTGGDKNPAAPVPTVIVVNNRDGIIEFATILLVFTGLLQAAILYRQHSLNQHIFATTHRPWLHVRSVASISNPIVSASSITIWLTVVNKGATRANLVESSINLRLYENPELPVPFRASGGYETESEGIGECIIEPGVAKNISKGYRLRSLEDASKFFSNGLHLYVYGYFKYRDSLGLLHQTAFCRRYDRSRSIFVHVKHPDYEYEE